MTIAGVAISIGFVGSILASPTLGLVLCAVVAPLSKGILQPYLGPVDLTGMVYATTLLSIGARLVRRRRMPSFPPAAFNVLVGVFLVFLLVGYLRSPVRSYAAQLVFRFVALDLGLLYMLIAWVQDRARLRRLALTFVWGGLLYGVLLLVSIVLIPGLLGPSMAARAVFEGTAPLTVGLFLAMGVILALSFAVSTMRAPRRLALLAFVALAVVQLVAVNSRGPLLGLALGTAVWIISSLRAVPWRRLILPASVVVGPAVLSLFCLPQEIVARYNPALLDLANPAATSASARAAMWRFVASHAGEWFVAGAGLYGFAFQYGGGPDAVAVFGAHPHNLLLEVYSSVGFFGAVCFSTLIVLPLVQAIRWALRRGVSPDEWMARGILGALVAAFVSAFFSMGLLDTRLVWFAAGCAFCLGESHG